MNTRKNKVNLSRATPLPNSKRKTLPGKFDVERILSSRRINELLSEEYLVHWSGYSLRESTWEPSAHLPQAVIR